MGNSHFHLAYVAISPENSFKDTFSIYSLLVVEISKAEFPQFHTRRPCEKCFLESLDEYAQRLSE